MPALIEAALPSLTPCLPLACTFDIQLLKQRPVKAGQPSPASISHCFSDWISKMQASGRQDMSHGWMCMGSRQLCLAKSVEASGKWCKNWHEHPAQHPCNYQHAEHVAVLMQETAGLHLSLTMLTCANLLCTMYLYVYVDGMFCTCVHSQTPGCALADISRNHSARHSCMGACAETTNCYQVTWARSSFQLLARWHMCV